MDTTRADHLSCYGYEYETSPNIDSLAKNSVLFKNVISQVPLTLPSHSSIFTGKYPNRLNVKDNGGFFLNESEVTIAELLSKNNYITAGIIGAFVLHSKWGISQGFQYYEDDVSMEAYQAFSLISLDRPANIVFDKAIKWLNNLNKSNSFFLFIHFFDPHAPYLEHKEFQHFLSNNYDQEIAYMDLHIGKLINALKEKGIYDNSIIIAFGDHGEGLGEHKENGHGIFLYDTTLKVPLIIKLPYNKIKNKIIEQQAQLVDIMPTILDLLDIKYTNNLDGISLVNLMIEKNNFSDDYDKRFAYSETYFPMIHYGYSPLFSIRTNKFKYIKAPKPEFYDLITNKNETINAISKYMNEANKFKNFLNKLSPLNDKIPSPSPISSEDEEKLKALGYISFHSAVNSLENLPDPKDKISIIESIEIAKRYLEKNNFDNAISSINYAINNDPENIEAWFTLGNSYARAQRYDEAVQAFNKANSLDNKNTYIIFNLAHAYQKKGDYKQALEWYRKAIMQDDKFFKAIVSAGELCYALKDYDSALEYFEKALKIKKDVPELYNYLAGIHIIKNDIKKAKEYASHAYKVKENIPLLNFYFGLIYEKENLIDKAIASYQKEILIYPNNHSAMINLGILYIKTKKYNEAEAIFRNLIIIAPNETKPYLLLANVLMRNNGSKQEIQELINKYEELKSKKNEK